MGCWHETCAISRLAIHHGEKIRFLPVVQNSWHFDKVGGWATKPEPHLYSGKPGCYNNDYWTYCCLPIKGEYNDYGNIENIPTKSLRDRAELKQLIGVFKKETIPLKLGENEYHDPATGKMRMKDILECLWEGRIYFKRHELNGANHNYLAVSRLMIKETVWQSLLNIDLSEEKYDFWSYKKEENGIEALKKNYIDVLDFEKNIPPPTKDNIKEHAKMWWESSKLRQKLEHGAFSSSAFPNPIFNEKYGSKHLVDAAAELDVIDSVIHSLRITVGPTCGSGSQSENFELWKDVNKVWIEQEEILEKNRRKYDECDPD